MYQRITANRTRIAGLVALMAALTGCDGDWRDLSLDPRVASGSRTVEGCPVSLPSGGPPVEAQDFNYGNRYVAAAIWSRGRLTASRDPGSQAWGQVLSDGSVAAKVGWWRGVSGRLTVVGERLDAPAPPLQARVPGGYGHIGFQSTELRFPTAGCWRVVGSVSGHDIAFVVLVVKKR